MRSAARLLAVVLVVLFAAPAAFAAAERPLDPAVAPVATRSIERSEAEAIARRIPSVRRALAANPDSYLASERRNGRWSVKAWSGGRSSRQTAEVIIDSATGRVLETWTGFQAAWSMARGYPGAFGRSVNAPWIWVTLCVLFVLPFVDPRRPLRLLHLDLLVLVAFSVSLAFFNNANLGLSVPIVAPLLIYVVVRLAAIGLRRTPRPAAGLPLLVPWRWLAAATFFLIGLRLGLNIVDGNVIDVGYSGVIGADRLAHGRELYGAFPTDNEHGDTYGPLLYLAYVPFELIWPWQGRWDDLPAAHAAAAGFDLACIALLFQLGRRLRGPELGTVLAYAWCAWPFTVYATNSGVNDALPAALILAAVLAAARPGARGALAAAAGLTKFAALPVLPLFATHGLEFRGRLRGLALFAAGVMLTCAIAALLAFAHTDPRTVWDRTLGFQIDRDAPFSVWGLYGGGWKIGQGILQAVVVLFACAVPFLPRRRDVVGLAALAGAILAAVQLVTTYWFYTYLLWFFPLALVALLAGPGVGGLTGRAWGAAARAPARSHPPAGPASSG